MNNLEKSFRCPISNEFMTDPVTTESGHTYDRQSIERWLQENNRENKMMNNLFVHQRPRLSSSGENSSYPGVPRDPNADAGRVGAPWEVRWCGEAGLPEKGRPPELLRPGRRRLRPLRGRSRTPTSRGARVTRGLYLTQGRGGR